MRHFAFLVLVTFLFGCNGFVSEVGGPGNGPGTGPNDPNDPRNPAEVVPPTIDPNAPPPVCDGVCLGENQLTRLTRDAYLRSVEDAFDAAVNLDSGVLPPDAVIADHFASNEGSHYIEATATSYLLAAEQLAESLAPGLTLSCDPARDAAACGREVFSRYAPVLFRRDVLPGWEDAYGPLFADTFADEGWDMALQITLSTLLQSPYFIYRIEPVEDDSIARLDGAALATRLAMFLWRTAPDADLRRAAAAGELDSLEGLRSQAERMLTDDKSNLGLTRFHEEWLGLDSLELSSDVSDALRRETSSFVVDAFRAEDDSAMSLFTSPTARIDRTLAEHYGIAEGDDQPVPGRVGLLTHGSVLAAHGGPGLSRPIMRGVFLVTDAICIGVGEPPTDVNLAEVMQMADALGPDATLREKVESVTETPGCIGCHAQLNPPGFAFESFDIDGRYVPGAADTSGEMPTENGPVAFSNHEDLLGGLLENKSIQACYTVQWFRYALGRANTVDDAHALWNIYQSFEGMEYSLRELLLSIVMSDPFTHRRAPVPAGPADCGP